MLLCTCWKPPLRIQNLIPTPKNVSQSGFYDVVPVGCLALVCVCVTQGQGSTCEAMWVPILLLLRSIHCIVGEVGARTPMESMSAVVFGVHTLSLSLA